MSLSSPVLPRGLKPARLDSTIVPGATGELAVHIDTFAFHGQTTVPISVATNDPATPTLRLELSFVIRVFVLCYPGFARYNIVQGEKEGTIPETLWADDGTDFRVVSVDSPYPHVRVAWHEAGVQERDARGAGRQWRVETTLASDAPVGPLGGFVVVTLDHPRQKKVYIPVTGFVRPAFAATPPSLTLGAIEVTKPAVTSVLVKNYSEADAELFGAATDVPGVRAEIEIVEKGRAWRVRVVFSRDAREGAFKGALTIRTSNARYPTIRVPLSGTIGGRR